MKKYLALFATLCVVAMSIFSAFAAEKTTVCYGDVDFDGSVTVKDATDIQKHIARLTDFSQKQKNSADVDGSGSISVQDVSLIQKRIAKIIDVFPAELSDGKAFEPTDNIEGDNVTARMLGKIEKYFLEAVNAERANLGLKPLAYNKSLDDAAQQRSLEITRLFSHTRPNGESCFTAVEPDQSDFSAMGENICKFYHFSGTVSIEQLAFVGSDEQLFNAAQIAFATFKNSPGHYANMIRGDFESTGIGISYVWNNDFNLPQFYLAHLFASAK